MGIKYEVSAITGKYTDKDGNEKNRYARLGVVMETKNGLALKLETIPVQWEGFAYLNEPREKQEGRTTRSNSRNDPDDDLPF